MGEANFYYFTCLNRSAPAPLRLLAGIMGDLNNQTVIIEVISVV